MNLVALTGRIASDPDYRATPSGTTVERFRLAVNRNFKKEGQPEADFISCVAFNKTADFIDKYFSKGDGINLTGSIMTGSYENKDGKKVYTTEVLVDRVEFGSKKKSESSNATHEEEQEDIPAGFTALEDDDMPF